jgi:hypothetical protein
MILDNQKTELHNDLQNAAAMIKFTLFQGEHALAAQYANSVSLATI